MILAPSLCSELGVKARHPLDEADYSLSNRKDPCAP